MRIALVFGACFLPLILTSTVAAKDSATPPTQLSPNKIRDTYRAQLNDNTVTIMTGDTSGTDGAVAQDIAAVADDGTALRIVPMIGKGPAQTVKDVMFMRGVDMGITHASVLNHFAKTGALGDLRSQVTYVAKLFNEEMHVLARADIDDVRALNGKTVNVGPEGSGTEITARIVFSALGIEVQEVHLEEAEAVAKLESGALDASVIISGKPVPILMRLAPDSGLKLLDLPYVKGIEDDTYPAVLGHDDYPGLIDTDTRIDTVAVCAVLISFNWKDDSTRTKKLERFVDRFFSNFDKFLEAPRHPKWREVNFAATLETWKRSPRAQRWIDTHRTSVAADEIAREKFERFLAQADDQKIAAQTADERAALFRAFMEWSKSRQKN